MTDPPDAILSTLTRGVAAAVPLVLAANGELVAERGGLINIGVEGTMLAGAFAGALAAWATGSPEIGMLAGAGAGGCVGVLFGAWTLWAKRDQIVAGLGINLLLLGVTGVAIQRVEAFAAGRGAAFVPPPLGAGHADWVWAAALLIVALTHLLIDRTRPGLTLRAVGENPEAADAAGVRVAVVRWAACLTGAALAGAGGAYLSLGLTNGFQEGMTAGRGFLALALVIFGRWKPFGVLAAALVFGILDAAQIALQPNLGRHVHTLYPALLALPYVLTLVALAGVTGRVRPPAALGVPYER